VTCVGGGGGRRAFAAESGETSRYARWKPYTDVCGMCAMCVHAFINVCMCARIIDDDDDKWYWRSDDGIVACGTLRYVVRGYVCVQCGMIAPYIDSVRACACCVAMCGRSPHMAPQEAYAIHMKACVSA
jgi:hypothetical protein